MGKLEAQVQSEYDYADMASETSVFVSEAKYSKLPLLSTGKNIQSWRYQYAKRWIDVVGSLAMIAVSLIPGLLIAALIALTSEGSVFYRETRIGRAGRPFRIWKFRSMSHAAQWQEVVKAESFDGTLLHWRVHKSLRDPRITAVGRFLRRSSLDELPQLINVFLGEMSLVGPRPEMPFIVRRYDSQQRQRLQVAPGITGLWQLSADRAFPIHDNIQHDLSYIKNRSFFMDLAILLHTPLRALRGGV